MSIHQLSLFGFNISSKRRSDDSNDAQSAISSFASAIVEFFERWSNHLLTDFFKDISEIIRRNEASAMTSLLLFKISVCALGVILGGNTVYLIQTLNEKTKTYSSILYYILMTSIILIGPDLFFLPPVTTLNGCTNLKTRSQFAAICFISPHCNTVYIISGLWHIDRGDFNHRKLKNEMQDTLNQMQELRNVEHFNHRLEEQLVRNNATISLAYCLFRAMFGLGMTWAGAGIYSSAVFLWAMVFYIATQVLYFMISKK